MTTALRLGVVAVTLAVLGCSLAGCGHDPAGAWSPAPGSASGSTTGPSQGGASSDPVSGLVWLSRLDLPPQAQDTLALIGRGGPFPYDQDGVVFENREGLLPDHPLGYYHEFTVTTPGSPDRGARRIIIGASGEIYYTDDHYESFERVGP